MNLALDALSLAHQHRLAGPPPWMFALLENAFGLPRPLMKLKKKLLSALLLSFLLNALATAAETVAGVEAGTAAGFVVVCCSWNEDEVPNNDVEDNEREEFRLVSCGPAATEAKVAVPTL